MNQEIKSVLEWLSSHPELYILLASSGLILAAWVLNWITKRILVRNLYLLLRQFRDDQQFQDFGVINRFSHIVPAIVLAVGVGFIPGLPEAVVTVVRNVCSGFIVFTIALALAGILDIINFIYQRRRDAHLHPIKGYLQVIKIIIYIVAAILTIALLIDRSPLILLSGLGAMAAVLMLIFQDTILSLVASVQIASNDMVRVGDWIEMPQLNADGDVIDIALHTVKVQNWDKTITTIPTKRMITESFKNWRGMQQSGGRRIKRSIFLDQQSVRFLDDVECKRLQRFNLLDAYLHSKVQEIEEWNHNLAERGRDEVNRRRVTNLGTFRAYMERYLRNNAGIHQDMTLIVRQLSPTADGLPMEIYCFTNTVAWAQYEAIQSDIFDHFLAILPEFNLRVFQHPGGADLGSVLERLRTP
jgi:miniconductance mechanosensitive channel